MSYLDSRNNVCTGEFSRSIYWVPLVRAGHKNIPLTIIPCAIQNTWYMRKKRNAGVTNVALSQAKSNRGLVQHHASHALSERASDYWAGIPAQNL